MLHYHIATSIHDYIATLLKPKPPASLTFVGTNPYHTKPMGTIDREALLFKRLAVSDFTEHTNTQIQQLFKELNDNISQKQALAIVQTPENVLVVCQYQNQIVGMATMATYKVISGHKGMIEDVVVSQHFRGYGIGKKLMQLLLAEANTLNLNEILLFSGHHRKAAIGLYTALGFVLKNSGLYRLVL